MNRRNAIKLAVGASAAGVAGVVTLTTAFKPKKTAAVEPKKIELGESASQWKYAQLNPAASADVAYSNYKIGSCMYGVSSSIISQLAEKIGEPYASFPIHMMKYGHGGIGGAGTVCGTLNGAAAVIGLLIEEKQIRDVLIAELFHWYETTLFPSFKPQEAVYDYAPPKSISKSVLCHASTTRWGKLAGFRIDSNERKERCRRLTADVAAKTVEILNEYFHHGYTTVHQNNETVNECMACHGSKGKLANTTGKMTCTSCHDKTVGHKLFGDVHYKYMDKRK
ncbi:C_GCAxxG_C_C family protein [Puteibacter caeruleilacunae]|nr:C_GCAxxG_C_C family protein [Puteibacter caeruleilacunae]